MLLYDGIAVSMISGRSHTIGLIIHVNQTEFQVVRAFERFAAIHGATITDLGDHKSHFAVGMMWSKTIVCSCCGLNKTNSASWFTFTE